MGKRNIIPFGPQHPVLPEPIHLDLVTEDEIVVDVIPSIGYVHRGLEKLCETKDFNEMVHVADRICGICSFIHSMAYCQGIEALMKVEVPERAKFLRTVWAELSRIHSHLMWLGLAADAFGFESLFMHSWRLREYILNIIEETTGGRVIFGACKVGGTRRDVSADTLSSIGRRLQELRPEFHEVTDVFIRDYSVQHRLSGVGVLPQKDARELGTVGPMLKASGVGYDIRTRGYAAYGAVDFEPVVETDGDCYARCKVRVREVFQSIDIIRQAIGKMPEGPFEVKVTGVPDGEYLSRAEQPRGEVVHYVKGNGTKFLARYRVRTPTFANAAAMVRAIRGSHLADVPNIILTIDPCISCIER